MDPHDPRYTDPATGEPDLGRFAKAVAEDARGYWEAQRALITLEVGERVGRVLAGAVLALVLLLVASAVFLLASFALAAWFATLLGSLALGYLAVVGVDILVGLLFYVAWRAYLRERIILAVIRGIHERP